MYICPTTSFFISYDWFYTADYKVILLSMSIDILRMIMKKDFPQKKEVYEEIALHKEAGNQSTMDNVLYKVLEKNLENSLDTETDGEKGPESPCKIKDPESPCRSDKRQAANIKEAAKLKRRANRKQNGEDSE